MKSEMWSKIEAFRCRHLLHDCSYIKRLRVVRRLSDCKASEVMVWVWCREECPCLENVTVTALWVQCDVTERAGKRNVDWRNRADWRAECWLKEQRGLESGMVTEGTERNGERNVDGRNRAVNPVTGRHYCQFCKVLFCLLTVCTVLIMQCLATQCCWRRQQVFRQSRNSQNSI